MECDEVDELVMLAVTAKHRAREVSRARMVLLTAGDRLDLAPLVNALSKAKLRLLKAVVHVQFHGWRMVVTLSFKSKHHVPS